MKRAKVAAKRRKKLVDTRFRHMTPRNITVVLLPVRIVHAFFPDLEEDLGRYFVQFVNLMDPLEQQVFDMSLHGMHLVGKTMSAHEILATISAPARPLPGGLGILAVPIPLEPPNEVLRIRLSDTLTRTLERLLSSSTMEVTTTQGDWFLQTGLELYCCLN